jgi:hypothetical protein
MNEEIAWGAVLLAVVTALGTAYNTYNQRQQRKDTLDSDVRLATLENNLRH